MNAKNFAPQIIRIRGRLLRIKGSAPWSPINGRIAVRFERGGVVTGRNEKIPFRVKRQRTAGMTTRIAQGDHLQNLLFGGHVEFVAANCESRKPVRPCFIPFAILAGFRLGKINVNPSVLFEFRVERESQKTVFELRENFDLPGNDRGFGFRFPDLDGALALAVKDPAICGNRHLQRIFHRIFVITVRRRPGVRLDNHFLEQTVGLGTRRRRGFGRFSRTCRNGERDEPEGDAKIQHKEWTWKTRVNSILRLAALVQIP